MYYNRDEQKKEKQLYLSELLVSQEPPLASEDLVLSQLLGRTYDNRLE